MNFNEYLPREIFFVLLLFFFAFFASLRDKFCEKFLLRLANFR